MDGHPLVNDTLLQMKFARIVSLLAKDLGVPEPEALDLFYRSKTYQNLCSGENGLHNMGDLFIVDELLLELGRSNSDLVAPHG